MQRYKQFHPVIIADFETDTWMHPPHNHNHYELIYIRKGKGIHKLNRETIGYEEGDLFLLGAEDFHAFEVHARTRFIYLKFTDAFFQNGSSYLTDQMKQTVKLVLGNRENRHGKITFSAQEKKIIAETFRLITLLQKEESKYESILLLQLVSLFELVKMYVIPFRLPRGQSNIEVLLQHIHAHIYQPHLLRLDHLAGLVNASATYIGKYFSRNMGCSVREYISRYRTRLIGQRLDSGAFSKKEIAAEFGFTDESHLNKFLKKENGNTRLARVA